MNDDSGWDVFRFNEEARRLSALKEKTFTKKEILEILELRLEAAKEQLYNVPSDEQGRMSYYNGQVAICEELIERFSREDS